MDEVESNTSQAKDGNVGGEKRLSATGQQPQICSATTVSHIIVLVFTAANHGMPLMCAIIFAGKEMMEESWVLGFDRTADLIGDENDVARNTGRGRRYPMGPTCNFNGHHMPSFCCCSKIGSITAELLVEMLKTVDKIGVFDQTDGVPPFLILLDGR